MINIKINNAEISAEYCQICKKGYVSFTAEHKPIALIIGDKTVAVIDCTNEKCALHKAALKEMERLKK